MSERVRRNYTEMAWCSAGAWSAAPAAHGRELLERMPLADASRVLDIGCGPGKLLTSLGSAAPRAQVVGTDVTEAMLRLAPISFRRVIGDAQALPLRSSCFDAAVLAFVLFHLPDPEAGLAEARRVLRAGGLLGILTWGEHAPHPAYDVWVDCLDEHGAPADPAPMVHTALDTADAGALTQALGAAGFADVRVKSQQFCWWPSREEFLEHSTVIGAAARRWRQLEPPARTACAGAAAERLAELPAEDFAARATVLSTVAVAG